MDTCSILQAETTEFLTGQALQAAVLQRFQSTVNSSREQAIHRVRQHNTIVHDHLHSFFSSCIYLFLFIFLLRLYDAFFASRSDPEFNLRHDWNSLLDHPGVTMMTNRTADRWPQVSNYKRKAMTPCDRHTYTQRRSKQLGSFWADTKCNACLSSSCHSF